MYKPFFGLSENPFNLNPDPRYLFLTPQTREALDEMTYGIQVRKGLILLTGEVGTGKTTLINRLLDWLHDQQTPAAFIFNSHLEISHLFDFVMADFGVPFDARLKGNALMRLNQWLFERYRAGETPVLIVDEAQGLPNHVLEEIRMLLNLETPCEKLLQIVLSGQPELELRLKQPELRQVKQRIALRCKTAALTLEQTHAYIQARLHIAGANGKPVFASEAMDAVYFYSRGIPRVMNLLCEHALINAYVDHVQPVPADIVAEVAREFQFDDIKPVAPPIDSGDTSSSNWIAAQSAFRGGLASLPAKAEPPWTEHSDPLTSLFSAPFALADIVTNPVDELAIAPMHCEEILGHKGRVGMIEPLGVQATVPVAPGPGQIERNRPSELAEFFSDLRIQFNSGLAIKPVPDALPRLLHIVDPKGRSGPLAGSNRTQVTDPQVSSGPPAPGDRAKSGIFSRVLMRIIALRLSLVRWSVGSRDRILSAATSPARTQWAAILHRRLMRSLQPLRAWYQGCLVWRGGILSAVGSVDLRHSKATLYRWLQQPWDPAQWRLSDLRFFEARRRLSFKKM
ncbi:MAG: AAA family ATPase [Candidatus Acidiferrales bacterium]